ncbi:MAG: DUF1285 domain-containing protein [Syntrophomonadaceae bacterium]|nr:DUF1285 domain-containing protein [Syntrophomonadaceae bacterium]
MDVKPITIRKNGKWYFDEAEMFRRNIVNILAVNMHRSENGSYYIKIGDDINPLYVEDVPFYATGLVEQEDGGIKLVFFDLQEFVLEGELKLTLKGDVPYISYKWEADTRLSRGIYWKLSHYFDIRGDETFIVIN